ncbi:MAG: FecR domain-containing protein [Desulfococcaceae bacterium]
MRKIGNWERGTKAGGGCLKQICLVCLLTGMLFYSVEPLQAAEEDTITITTQKGDKLIKISKDLLQNPNQWTEIAKKNKLRNPHVIQSGTELAVPVKLLKEEAVTGEAAFVKGDVRMQIPDGAEWIPLHAGDAVHQKSSVKTGEKSRLQIRYADGSVLTLEENTEMLISACAEKKRFGIVRDLMLGFGKMTALIQKSRLNIRTETAVAGIRGTIFRLSSDAQTATRSEVLEGIVDMEAQGKRVSVNSGEGTLVQKGMEPMDAVKLLPAPKVSGLQNVYQQMPIRFGIEAMEESTAFHAQLAKESDMLDLVSDAVISPGESFDVSGIPDGTYYLRFSGIDKYGLEGIPSEVLAVNIQVKAPAEKPQARALEIPKNTVLFLADTSGSMQEKIIYRQTSEDRRETKMAVVKKLLTSIYEQLPAGRSTGILQIAYLPGKKEVIEDFLPISIHEKDKVLSEIQDSFMTDYPVFNRRTPLAEAFLQMDESKLKDLKVPVTLVLMSDGLENFHEDDGDEKGAVMQIRRIKEKYRENFILHTVYAGEKDKDSKGKDRLEQMAAEGGGKHFSATEMMEHQDLLPEFCRTVYALPLEHITGKGEMK